MLQIEAIFENGAFRPLQKVNLTEKQRVVVHVAETLEMGSSDAEEVTYSPLPLRNVRRIPVEDKKIGRIPLIPVNVEADASEM